MRGSSHRSGDALRRGRQLLVRDVRQHVLPDRQHHPGGLDHPERPRQEPDMEMRAAVTPSVQVDASEVTQRKDGPLDTRRDTTEVCRKSLGQIDERVDVDTAGEPDGAGKAASDRGMESPVVVRPDGSRRSAVADPARRPARLTATRRFGDLARCRLARNERFAVGKGHRHSDSFRDFARGRDSAAAMPLSTTPTMRERAFFAGHPWRPRRWTYGQATALNATSAVETTSSTAGNEPSRAPSWKNWMNGWR